MKRPARSQENNEKHGEKSDSQFGEESWEAGAVPGEETPGICGMSALKRSDGGCSGIKATPCLYTGNLVDIQSVNSRNSDGGREWSELCGPDS